jgi:membrane protein DedA with SNARE-associated domain
VTHFITQHGLPGETALILFGVLASQGHYNIVEVIAVASAAAIVGDNLGYWIIGRWGGRRLFERWDWLKRYSERVLPRAELLMEKHGGKTVFFGRFITVLRYTAAWLAGLGRMHWARFLFWNAAGGICWATLVGLVAYYGGKSAADGIQKYGIFAAGGLVAILLLGWVATHFGKRWLERKL